MSLRSLLLWTPPARARSSPEPAGPAVWASRRPPPVAAAQEAAALLPCPCASCGASPPSRGSPAGASSRRDDLVALVGHEFVSERRARVLLGHPPKASGVVGAAVVGGEDDLRRRAHAAPRRRREAAVGADELRRAPRLEGVQKRRAYSSSTTRRTGRPRYSMLALADQPSASPASLSSPSSLAT